MGEASANPTLKVVYETTREILAQVLTLLTAIVWRRLSMTARLWASPRVRRRVRSSGLPVWWPVLVGERGEKVLFVYYTGAPDGRWSLQSCSEERNWEDDQTVGFTLGEWRRALEAYRKT